MLRNLIYYWMCIAFSHCANKAQKSTFYSIENNSYLTFDKNNRILIKDKDDVSTMFMNTEEGIVEIDFYNVFQDYIIDRKDSDNSKFISVMYNNDIRISGYHLFHDESLLVVTPLKNLDGIKDHFTEPVVYSLDKEKESNIKKNPIFEISFIEPYLDTTYYINYCEPSKCEYENNYSVRISDITSKLDIPADPRIWAYKTIQANIVVEGIEHKGIPVLYGIQKYIGLGKNDVKDKLLKQGIDEYFLVAYRYNPGRTRIVNKVFKEVIIGQVQTFKVYSVESFLEKLY